MNESSLVVRSAAKINLTLDVLGLRPDGYHELRSIVHTIGLWDTISFRFGPPRGLSFECDQSELQSDDNLCLQAARLWSQAAHRVLDCHISLEKTIPSGAGLGGGSGNAAATLAALNGRFDNALSHAQLHHLATKLGADVPLFLNGGCALIEGIGERITPLRALEGWIVVLQPEQKLSTPQVFRAFDELNRTTANPSTTNASTTNASTALLQAIEGRASFLNMAKLLQNDLTTAAAKCGVDVEQGLNQLQQSGAVGTGMTGSGSAVFGVFADESSARRALNRLQTQNWSFAAVASFSAFGWHQWPAQASNRVLDAPSIDAPQDAFP